MWIAHTLLLDNRLIVDKSTATDFFKHLICLLWGDSRSCVWPNENPFLFHDATFPSFFSASPLLDFIAVHRILYRTLSPSLQLVFHPNFTSPSWRQSDFILIFLCTSCLMSVSYFFHVRSDSVLLLHFLSEIMFQFRGENVYDFRKI